MRWLAFLRCTVPLGSREGWFWLTLLERSFHDPLSSLARTPQCPMHALSAQVNWTNGQQSLFDFTFKNDWWDVSTSLTEATSNVQLRNNQTISSQRTWNLGWRVFHRRNRQPFLVTFTVVGAIPQENIEWTQQSRGHCGLWGLAVPHRMTGEIQKSPRHCTFHFMFKSKELLFPEPPPLVKNVPSPSHNAKKKKN